MTGEVATDVAAPGDQRLQRLGGAGQNAEEPVGPGVLAREPDVVMSKDHHRNIAVDGLVVEPLQLLRREVTVRMAVPRGVHHDRQQAR